MILVDTITMRRAIKKNTDTNLATGVISGLVKMCAREGCGNTLTLSQKKFCSQSCRNEILSTGNGAGELLSKYKPEYATARFKEYITACEKKNEPNLVPTQSSFIVIQDARMPTFDDYAEYLGVTTPTLKNWALVYPEFAVALDRLKRFQKTFLINNGLSGRYNPTIAKLLLGINHGMVERKEVDNTHKMIGVVRQIYGEADRIEREMYGSEERQ